LATALPNTKGLLGGRWVHQPSQGMSHGWRGRRRCSGLPIGPRERQGPQATTPRGWRAKSDTPDRQHDSTFSQWEAVNIHAAHVGREALGGIAGVIAS
jgi:hypothetical protein